MNPLRRLYKRSHRLRRAVRRRKDGFTYHAARVALWLPRHLSLARALALADRVGDLAYDWSAQTRERSLASLNIAFGDSKSPQEKEAIARAALRNAARCLVEVAKIEEIRPQLEHYGEIEGWEHWETVRGLGRGAIVITGHIGNWELLAAFFAARAVPIAAIARQLNDPRLNQLLVDFRRRNGVNPILRESPGSSREIVKIFHAHGLLAMLIDQDILTPSLSVPFFGRPARTPVAAATLAIRRNLPVIPAFACRRADGGHHFVIHPPVYPPGSGDRLQDALTMTRRFSEIIEAHIRRYPTEWVWWHKRWRRRPVPNLDLDSRIDYQNNVLQGAEENRHG